MMEYPICSDPYDILCAMSCTVNALNVPVRSALRIAEHIRDDGFFMESLDTIRADLVEFDKDLRHILGLGVMLLMNPETGEVYLLQPEHMPEPAVIPPRPE